MCNAGHLGHSIFCMRFPKGIYHGPWTVIFIENDPERLVYLKSETVQPIQHCSLSCMTEEHSGDPKIKSTLEEGARVPLFVRFMSISK